MRSAGWHRTIDATKGVSPGDSHSLGLGVDDDMQLLLKGVVADEAYVSGRSWERELLGECPFHKAGGCGLRRLGSYPRVWPEGCRVGRYLCPVQGTTISLLPQSLAAGVTGPLAAIERAADAVERLGAEGAVDEVHPADDDEAIGHVGAVRSVRRRATWVRSTLLAIVTLLPARFIGVEPTLAGLRAALGVESVLVELRRLVEEHLGILPRPFGFRARSRT